VKTFQNTELFSSFNHCIFKSDPELGNISLKGYLNSGHQVTHTFR